MRRLKLILVLVFVLGAAGTAPGRIIYVDANAPPGGDGSSWATAYKYLQDALADANSKPKPVEIWVAGGVYKPDRDEAGTVTPLDRTATFDLIKGVTVYGGLGGTEDAATFSMAERDLVTNETILSGDLDGNDVDVNDARDLAYEPTRGENSYHVVSGIDNDETAQLDGFTITGGNASGYMHWYGGGVYLSNSKAMISNCVVRGNKSYCGGGMYNRRSGPVVSGCIVMGNLAGSSKSSESKGGGICCYRGSPTISDCIISRNVVGGYSARGGGIYCDEGCSATVTGCNIIGNAAALGRLARGGGIAGGGASIRDCVISENFAEDAAGGLVECDGPIIDCLISDNVAQRDSGGMSKCHGSVVNCTVSGNRAEREDTGGLGKCGNVINCVIVGNRAGRDAGGMGSCYGIVANCIVIGNRAGANGGALRDFDGVLTNCTFAENVALHGMGLAFDGKPWYSSNLEVLNCIIWDGGEEIWNNDGSVITIGHSDIRGGDPCCYDPCETMVWGSGNIDTDPCFTDLGYWDPNGTPSDPNDDFWVGGDYHLRPGSPCVDAGDNNSVAADVADLDGDSNTAEPIPWDLDGNPRVVDGNNDGNTVVDMGAYEFFMLPVEVAMRFTPQALNPGSKGNWMKAHFVLPEGYAVGDVDANRPAVVEAGGIESDYINVFVNDDGLVEIEAAFDRGEFCGIVTGGEPMEVTVVGSLSSGQQFYGTDTIKITTNFLKYLGTLASRWLEGGCG
ncbi:MAG: hypothetical protein ACYTBJ_23750, partial [Planctomycetota bacterium]